MIKVAFCLLAVLVTTPPAHAQATLPGPDAPKPNIIFIFTDDHASQSIGAYGSKINQTPNLDRIASEGAIFLNSFCANSICGPSRATILTGLHSHMNGFKDNTSRFDSSQQTFPKLLQKAGYATAMIGKYHLWNDPQGFDKWMILPGQGEYYNPQFKTQNQELIQVQGYVTDVITDFGLQWIDQERDKDKPFMLMLQHKAPHRTWMPGPQELSLYRDKDIPEPDTLFDDYKGRGPGAAKTEMQIDRHMYFAYDLYCPVRNDEFLFSYYEENVGRMTPEQRADWDAAFEPENKAFLAKMEKMTDKQIVQWKYQRYIKNYLRCIAGVDRNVGRVLDYLDANPQLKENTIVIYSSDQGFFLGEHGWYDKRWMYEQSLKMPLMMRWPGVIEPGTRLTQLVQNIDYAPTFLDIAGVEPETPMQGRSLLDLWRKDAEPWRDAVYYRYYESQVVHNVPAHYGIRTAKYSLMHFYESNYNYYELYDLEKDPQQMHNVYDDPAYKELASDLKIQLTDLREEYKDNKPINAEDWRGKRR